MVKSKGRKSTYEQRGVSSDKHEVHKAIENLDKGLFPGAFCKILPYRELSCAPFCKVLHADTAGTKTSLAWLLWKTSKSLMGIRNVAIDSIVMNIDDVACVGAITDFEINQTISRNKFIVPAEVVQALISGASDFLKLLARWRVNSEFAGGETADVPDTVRTFEVGNSLRVRMYRSGVIDASRICPGDLLVGFSSTGMCEWESEYTSGIGANGLTNGRHDTLHPMYRKYTETYAPQLPKRLVYRGPYRLDDEVPYSNMTVGKALLSPTRTYVPLIRKLMDRIHSNAIHGFIHCTGGGQTKIKKFGMPGNRYMITDPFPVPPVFRMLKDVSGATWRDMFQVYNMGWRLIAAVSDMRIAERCILDSHNCGIDAQIVGEVVKMRGTSPHKVEITAPNKSKLKY